jgi:serine/threonine-protein kinase
LVARGLRVVDVLGVGGSAIVYRARDERHDRDVAIKIMRQALHLPNAEARFKQEIRVAAGLRHAHILPLMDSGALQDGRPFAVMPVARGRPLRAMILEGSLAINDAVRLAREIAEALSHLHECGFVHRDVKPENILVEGGHAVLTDFGIAAPVSSLLSSDDFRGVDWWLSGTPTERLTPTGGAVGTLHYMAPELFESKSIDGRTDVYALGVVLYEMLTTELPYHANSPSQLIKQITRDRLPDVRKVRPGVPLELEAIIERSTARKPADRYESAGAMASALAHIPTQGGATAQRLQSGDSRSAGLMLVALLAAMIVGFSLWARDRQANALDPNRIVVADLVNDTGDPSLGGTGVLGGDVFTAALTAGTKLTVVNSNLALPSRQEGIPPADSVLARETRSLIAATHAGLVVTGAFVRAGTYLDLFAEVTDTRSGRVLGTVGPVHGSIQNPDRALRSVADSVVAIVRRRHAPPV